MTLKIDLVDLKNIIFVKINLPINFVNYISKWQWSNVQFSQENSKVLKWMNSKYTFLA